MALVCRRDHRSRTYRGRTAGFALSALLLTKERPSFLDPIRFLFLAPIALMQKSLHPTHSMPTDGTNLHRGFRCLQFVLPISLSNKLCSKAVRVAGANFMSVVYRRTHAKPGPLAIRKSPRLFNDISSSAALNPCLYLGDQSLRSGQPHSVLNVHAN